MKFVTIVSTVVISLIAIMAFITLAFSVQGIQVVPIPTVTPVPTIEPVPTPAPTIVPDNGTQLSEYGYVITYPAPVKAYDVGINPNPSYVAKATATVKATATIKPTATPKPSATHRPTIPPSPTRRP
jgi:hypothetical protein